jgi:hypothetical protein
MLKAEHYLSNDRLAMINFDQDLKVTEIIITDWSFEKQLFVNSFSLEMPQSF